MLIFSLLLGSIISITNGYKIGILTADIANSQVLLSYRIGSTLASAGHNVTVILISSFKDRDTSSLTVPIGVNVKKIDANVGKTRAEADQDMAEIMYEPLSDGHPKLKKFSANFMNILTTTCKNTVKNKEFLKWLEDEKFDLAFAHTYHTCPIGLIHAAKIPTWIWLERGSLKEYMATCLGAPNIPSFISPITAPFHDTMNFWERAESLKKHILSYYFYPKMIPELETDYFREFVDPNFPSLTDLAKKCPLAMVNSNDLYDLPRPLPAKIVNIGGLGAKLKDAKPLPPNLEEIAQRGDGLVLFSFGSVAQFHLAPENWKIAIFSAFKRLKNYQFVVRYDGEYEGELPENVHFFKWLPQPDLLQHKRMKAFVTHGGYNSLQEAIGAGVPLVMIGLFADQMKNSKLAEKHGFARILSKANFTTDAVYEALDDVLHDPTYSKNVKRLSAMVNKQPIPAEMLLVKWTEFVAEFKTLENLVPASTRLNNIQYFSLDVIGAAFFVLLIGVYLIIRILSWIIRRDMKIFKGKNKTE